VYKVFIGKLGRDRWLFVLGLRGGGTGMRFLDRGLGYQAVVPC